MSILSTCVRAKLEGKKVVCFGAGITALGVLSALNYSQKDLISYFCDNDMGKDCTVLGDVPVYHANKLLDEDRDNVVIIITAYHLREIAEQIFSMGFKNVYSRLISDANKCLTIDDIDAWSMRYNKHSVYQRYETLASYGIDEIRKLFSEPESLRTFDGLIDKFKEGSGNFESVLSRDRHYCNSIFANDLIENEVYVDAGVCTVTTVVNFIFFTRGKYKKIYAFEPDPKSYLQLADELLDLRDVSLIQAGLYDAPGELSFDLQGSGSRIVQEGDVFGRRALEKIKVVNLDDFLKEPPTFIKMDIEGSEYNALLGTQELIKEHRPKLAISAYHRDDDLIRLPNLIRELVPEYKFYLRHHDKSWTETVLYAKI